jgi:uncharacterized membrane protein YjjP (DUF1212 family)
MVIVSAVSAVAVRVKLVVTVCCVAIVADVRDMSSMYGVSTAVKYLSMVCVWLFLRFFIV